MGLGAAGCGYEYGMHPYRCAQLTKRDKIFTCHKYEVVLENHHITGHPFRCKKCLNNNNNNNNNNNGGKSA